MIENFLLNPDIIYLALVLGFMLALMAVLTPGTTIIEISALFAFLIAGWGIYNLPVNLWALFVLSLGVVFFALAVRRRAQRGFLAAAIAALIVGTLYLLRGPRWWLPIVHPLLGTTASLLMGGLVWLVTIKVVEAEIGRPTHDLEGLIGRIGEARTEVHHSGTAQIAGEEWSVRSQAPIPAGTSVRVRGREGFTLEVEAVEEAGERERDEEG